ncbi:MAG: GspMb/PilO family protein [Planctomycetota bacterium]|jgi:hypothetical protein
MKIEKKHFKTMAFVWSSCFVLFVLARIVIVSPQKQRQKTIKTQLTEIKQVYDSAVNATQNESKTKLNKEVEELRNKVGDYAIYFKDSANLTFDISQIANDKKVTSFGIKTKSGLDDSATKDNKYIFEKFMNISFTASFNRFATLLNTLERKRPPIFIDNFEITRPKDSSLGHEVNIGLAVFVQKQLEN